MLVEVTKPSFVCVTETWFTPDIDDELIAIRGFLSFRRDRRDNPDDSRRGGGTVIYAASHVSPSVVSIPLDFGMSPGVEYSVIRFYDPNVSFLLYI